MRLPTVSKSADTLAKDQFRFFFSTFIYLFIFCFLLLLVIAPGMPCFYEYSPIYPNSLPNRNIRQAN